MIKFPDSYFQKEVREGFEVASMMKRAWAGQLEVLQVIREICERHHIKWFVDYGTLLGAVRHKGFIPWDDDMDIGMMRDQLNLFIRYAKDELPEGYKLLCMDLEPEYDSLIVRVVNSTVVSMDADRMQKFHGCPYVLGIDIFPMDYLSKNPEERALHLELVNIILGAVDSITAPETTKEEVDAYIAQVEELLNVKIDRTRPLKSALLLMVEKLCGIFGPDDSDEVTGIWRLIWQKEFIFKKEWFTNLEELPFETVTVPVPSHYHEVLSLKIGVNYMTPIRHETHNYPFYQRQEDMIFEKYGFRPE